jgi:hypothetical protein
MTTFQDTPPIDAIAESQQLIARLEQLRDELPLAEDILAVHRPTHHELQSSQAKSERAVAAWRAALARRWDCEVAGRRLYKRTLRQLAQHYGGDDTPAVQAISRGEAEANSSPAELLTDLRRLQAALLAGLAALDFAGERLPQIEQHCAMLEAAIAEAHLRETQRRVATLDNRMASAAYFRARKHTGHLLAEHFGERSDPILGGLLD